MKPGISLCMIVRDEAAVLDRCLASAREICDEIIVVDTGSTDSTRDIARRYGARLFEFPWTGDFSAARNESLAHAEHEWILQLDADEFLYEGDYPKIRAAIEAREVHAYNVRILNDLPSGGLGTLLFPRLFRNGEGCRYEGIVHNQLRVPGAIATCEIRIHHTGYGDPAATERRYARSAPLLRRQIEENPHDPTPHYHLAILAHSRGNADEALFHARRAAEFRTVLESAAPDNNVEPQLPTILDLVALGHQLRDEWETAARILEHALTFDAEFPDALFDLAYTREHQGRRDEAIEIYQRYLRACETWAPSSTHACSMLRSLESTHIAWNNIGGLYRAAGRVDDARAAFARAIEIDPNLAVAYRNLGNLEAQAGEFVTAAKLFRAAVSLGGPDADLLEKLGVSLANTGAHLEAITIFDRVTQLRPRCPIAWRHLGVTWSVLGRMPEAERALEQAVELEDTPGEAALFLERIRRGPRPPARKS